MEDRRRTNRHLANLPVKFRVVQQTGETRVSEIADGSIRDVSTDGLSIETEVIEVDGLHVSYNHHPAQRNLLYLQWGLPSGRTVKAVAETVWYERISASGSKFVLGLRFCEISQEDREALRDFVEAIERIRPQET
jgi:hypothetical protein